VNSWINLKKLLQLVTPKKIKFSQLKLSHFLNLILLGQSHLNYLSSLNPIIYISLT